MDDSKFSRANLRGGDKRGEDDEHKEHKYDAQQHDYGDNISGTLQVFGVRWRKRLQGKHVRLNNLICSGYFCVDDSDMDVEYWTHRRHNEVVAAVLGCHSSHNKHIANNHHYLAE